MNPISTPACIAEFIPILFVFVLVVYTKQLIDFSTTILGKLVSVGLIVYYTTVHKMYGLIVAAIVIFLQHYTHLLHKKDGNYVREGFGKDDFMKAHCDNGKLKYKSSNVNPEMAEHVFPEIKYNSPAHRCHPCDAACNYTIMEDKLTKEEELLIPKEKEVSIPEKTILDFWKLPMASMGVVTEPFSYV